MKKVLLEELSWFEVGEWLKTNDLILIPVASIEQHGPHTPLATDTINVEYLVWKAAERTEVLVAPTQKLGVSKNHMDFPGTITLQPETLVAILVDVCTSLASHGFRKLLIVNGHGGNNATVDVAAFKIKHLLPDCIVGVTYIGSLGAEAYDCLEAEIKYHADEGETSWMLVTRPDLVRMDRAVREIPHPPSDLYAFQSDQVFKQRTFYGLPRTKDVTDSGTFGDATLATVEKGKKLVEAAINDLVKEIEKLKETERY